MFIKLELIGEGSFGKVYKGMHAPSHHHLPLSLWSALPCNTA